MLELACIVEKGIREYNDDRASINGKYVEEGTYITQAPDGICLAIVCDGLGGYSNGHKAAEMCVKAMMQLYGEKVTGSIIESQLSRTNDEIEDFQRKDRNHSNMSTTVAGLYINGDDFIAFNVGDTRIYRYRSYLSQLSTDHSKWQDQLDLGLTPESGMESVLTRCIGGQFAEPEILHGIDRVFTDDVYIICTDGVWGVLDAEDFEGVLSQDVSTSNAAALLMELAKKNNSQDNLSIILIRRLSKCRIVI